MMSRRSLQTAIPLRFEEECVQRPILSNRKKKKTISMFIAKNTKLCLDIQDWYARTNFQIIMQLLQLLLCRHPNEPCKHGCAPICTMATQNGPMLLCFFHFPRAGFY